jgi:DNA-binding winged helix-turn-helix (wHTH) protein
VRTALGDRPKNSVFIETLHKRGYRFVAPVSESAASSPVPAGLRRNTPLWGVLVRSRCCVRRGSAP